jgi:hypothetical protein
MQHTDSMAYQVTHARRLRGLYSMALLLAVCLWGLYRSAQNYYYIPIGICLVAIGLLVYLGFIQKNTIEFGADFIRVNKKKTYPSTEIEKIMIYGSNIGIKLPHKKLVPVRLSFAFRKDEHDRGLKEIEEWSTRNNKRIQYQFFWQWV